MTPATIWSRRTFILRAPRLACRRSERRSGETGAALTPPRSVEIQTNLIAQIFHATSVAPSGDQRYAEPVRRREPLTQEHDAEYGDHDDAEFVDPRAMRAASPIARARK